MLLNSLFITVFTTTHSLSPISLFITNYNYRTVSLFTILNSSTQTDSHNPHTPPYSCIPLVHDNLSLNSARLSHILVLWVLLSALSALSHIVLLILWLSSSACIVFRNDSINLRCYGYIYRCRRVYECS